MKDHVRKAMEKALIDIDGQLWGKTYIPDEFVEKFADYLMQTKPLSDEDIQKLLAIFLASFALGHITVIVDEA